MYETRDEVHDVGSGDVHGGGGDGAVGDASIHAP